MFLGALPLPDIVEDLLSVGVVGQLLAALLLLLPLLLLLLLLLLHSGHCCLRLQMPCNGCSSGNIYNDNVSRFAVVGTRAFFALLRERGIVEAQYSAKTLYETRKQRHRAHR